MSGIQLVRDLSNKAYRDMLLESWSQGLNAPEDSDLYSRHLSMFGCSAFAIAEAWLRGLDIGNDRQMLAMSILSDAQEHLSMIESDPGAAFYHRDTARKFMNRAKFLLGQPAQAAEYMGDPLYGYDFEAAD